MICKYCGNNINMSSLFCEHCGRTAVMDAGNGFWDLKTDSANGNAPPQTVERVNEKEVVRISKIPLIICAVVCALCLISVLLSEVSHNRAVKDLENYYQNRLIAQENEYETNLESLNSDLKIMREEESQYRKLLEDVNSNEPSITVLSKPLGFTNEPGTVLFSFEPSKITTSVIWEKMLNGEWMQVFFDADHNNVEYGMHLQEEGALSSIVATNLTLESEGLYRCRALFEDGNEHVDYVSISIKSVPRDNQNHSNGFNHTLQSDPITSPDYTGTT